MLKGLIYTKADYEELLVIAKNAVKEARKSNDTDSCIAYSNISYNAFAGLIRAGSLHEKRNGLDGIVEISVNAGGKEYNCKEFILEDILKEEYAELIRPYQDTSYSYTKLIRADNKTELVVEEESIKKEPRDFSKIADTFQNVGDKIKNINILPAPKEKEEEVFEYDPDYDHFYDSNLPRLLEELDYIPKEISIKSMGIIVSTFITILTLIFLL